MRMLPCAWGHRAEGTYSPPGGCVTPHSRCPHKSWEAGAIFGVHASCALFLRCEIEISMAAQVTAHFVNGSIRSAMLVASILSRSVHRAAIIIAYINGEAP